MRKLMESRKGMLLGALFSTAVCLMYGISFVQKGFSETMQVPSPMANIILLAAFAVLAIICWYRWLCWKEDRKEFRNKKKPALWAGMAVLCLLMAGIWLFWYFHAGRSAAALAVCVWMLVCAAVSAVRAVKFRRRKP